MSRHSQVGGIAIHIGRRVDATVHRSGCRTRTYLGISYASFERIRRAALANVQGRKGP